MLITSRTSNTPNNAKQYTIKLRYQTTTTTKHISGSKFVPCKTDDEKEEERKRYNHSIQSILPASFRLGSDCHPLFRDKFIKELDEHAGKPIEITIETKNQDGVTVITGSATAKVD